MLLLASEIGGKLLEPAARFGLRRERALQLLFEFGAGVQ